MTAGATWKLIGASVAGTSHRSRGTACQDAFRVKVFGPQGDWLAVAVSDGAGSASRSDVGAALLCDALIERVTALPLDGAMDQPLLVAAVTEARGVLVREAERTQSPLRELACTLLLAVVGPDQSAFAQVGDGAIVIGGEGPRVVFWPEASEYANATAFVTDEDFQSHTRCETVNEAVRELAVITDGLQRLALNFATLQPHDGFFRPFFSRLGSEADAGSLDGPLRDFLDSPRINERTDDDKTLVLATRRP